MLRNFFRAIYLSITGAFETKLQPGERIADRYEVQKCIGMGSYGFSYLVYDIERESEIVLKTLRLHKRISKRGKLSFQKEVEILREVQHPNFPLVYEQGIHKRIPYFTMEYINGKTFEQLIFQDGKVYSEGEAFQIGFDLFLLMGYLHQKGIIHRDLRIPNVMLDGKMLKVIDFGLAKYREDRVQINHKPFKRIKDIKRLATPESDYYALGHFLLFLLYSQYVVREEQKEKSWEEELSISEDAKRIIKKLLLTSTPYQEEEELKNDLLNLIQKSGRRKENVIF